MTPQSSANSQSPLANSQLKVAVLTGGIGAERDVSLQSGQCVTDALKKAGLEVIFADITPADLSILDDGSIDVFFPALHGKFGEDGELQEILENKGLVYTGSGPKASRFAFDKMAGKRAFNDAGINTPQAIEFTNKLSTQHLENQFSQSIAKYVVKPVTQGSSVGISIVTDRRKVISAARKCLNEFGDCMIEEYIPGREITVSLLCGRPLPIIEVKPKTGFYNYRAKYIDEQTEYLFDTITEPVLASDIEAAALGCFNALGCRHFGRVDFILGDDRIAYVLEVNTIPGFTSHSLLPKAAQKTGLSMSDLCVKIIEAALEGKKQEVNSVSAAQG